MAFGFVVHISSWLARRSCISPHIRVHLVSPCVCLWTRHVVLALALQDAYLYTSTERAQTKGSLTPVSGVGPLVCSKFKCVSHCASECGIMTLTVFHLQLRRRSSRPQPYLLYSSTKPLHEQTSPSMLDRRTDRSTSRANANLTPSGDQKLAPSKPSNRSSMHPLLRMLFSVHVQILGHPDSTHHCHPHRSPTLLQISASSLTGTVRVHVVHVMKGTYSE